MISTDGTTHTIIVTLLQVRLHKAKIRNTAAMITNHNGKYNSDMNKNINESG